LVYLLFKYTNNHNTLQGFDKKKPGRGSGKKQNTRNPAPGPDTVKRDRGSTKNNEIKYFWFFGIPGTIPNFLKRAI